METMPRLNSWDARRSLRLAALALGPVATLLLTVSLLGGDAPDRGSAALAVVVMWSPLFFALPALLLQHERDIALSGVRPALWRGVRLVPHLAVSRDSTVRVETWVSLTAWAVLLVLAGRPAVDAALRLVDSLLPLGS